MASGDSARHSGLSIHAETQEHGARRRPRPALDLGGREQSRGQVPAAGARVPRVEPAVGEPVHRHGQRARRSTMASGHPAHDADIGPAVGGEHHGHVGEGQREDGVLELDGVEEVPNGDSRAA